ncbi:tryptophan synthase [Neocallimastix lanati (nom. inval.)]|jgi:tryptophan synthase beta chain|uniref:Tryptophan synthase n=1 Tax=Neocallimastix californiae TaxID=1754190 RepID=A0A1Y2ES69_9FUNG|nr:tryptophan synthase [Neocallimastix sp. JGI-2020a]ORY74431.1 tryptophan synthase [Neocallimastix californiae]|eukprot:ORY74431.1 tryptophan synthase [Neocallimastix californiae]
MEGDQVPEFVKKMFPNGPPPHLKEKFPNGPPPEILAMLMKGKPAPGAETPKEQAPVDAPKEQASAAPTKPVDAPAGGPPAGAPGMPPFMTPEMFMEMMRLGMTPPKGVLQGKEREEREKKMIEMKNNIYGYKYKGQYPDEEGYFGIFGGVCNESVKDLATNPAPFIEASIEITRMLKEYIPTDEFRDALREIRKNFQGRPTPLYECKRIEEMIKKNNNGKSGRIFIKREDLNHTGAHKLNHCMAEALIAKKLGKKCLVAGTGAGQHGLAVATAAAHFGLDCKIFMGTIDVAKEHPNVSKMRVLGAEVIPVDVGGKSLKEANDASIAYFSEHPDEVFQCIGSVVAVHPWPYLVREFQRVIGDEAREQILEQTGRLPNHVVACLGGGSNSLGTFTAFLDNKDIKLYPVEPLGRGTKFGDHAACLLYGHRGSLHGSYSYVLQDENGEYKSHSVASGLCYPSVGPEHAFLKEIERTIPCGANDHEALEAFFLLSKAEGVIPALESSHGFVQAVKLAKQYPDDIILCNISGRGDKDVDYVIENFPEYVDRKEFDLLKC